MNRYIAWGTLAAASTLALSACGGGSSGQPAAHATTSTGSSGAALHVATTSLGKVLVDSHGMTVYLLSSDKPNKSTCSKQCLQYWPIVAAPHSKAALPGVTGKVGSTKATNGSPIATVAGWPLHTYVQDSASGDVAGEGVSSFGGVWYAVSPNGQPVKKAGGSSTAPSSGGGGYGGY